MKYILEVAEDKNLFAEEVFKSMSFVKDVKIIRESETKPDEVNTLEIEKLKEEYQFASIENEELSEDFADVDLENWGNE